jgi:ABC-type lipoprotein release transport system permease subunit
MALPLPRVFDSMFSGLVLHEPHIYVIVPLFVAALMLVATLIPARRALRVNPTETLRHD